MTSITDNRQLTPAQAETLGALKALLSLEAIPPSLQELADALKVTRATVRVSLERLERKGYIKRKPGQFRSITILERAA